MKTVCLLGPDGSGKDTILDLMVEQAKERSLLVDVVYTTKVIHGNEYSALLRQTLGSSTATNAERFNAAWHLYKLNEYEWQKKNARCDYLIYYRGNSSFLTYNFIEGLPEGYQASIVPKTDIAVYLDAPFDDLTERIKRRQSFDFQDVNEPYRRKVWEEGRLDFLDFNKHFNIKHFIATNSNNDSPSKIARDIWEAIINAA